MSIFLLIITSIDSTGLNSWMLQACRLTVKKSLPGEEVEEYTSLVDTAVYTRYLQVEAACLPLQAS